MAGVQIKDALTLKHLLSVFLIFLLSRTINRQRSSEGGRGHDKKKISR